MNKMMEMHNSSLYSYNQEQNSKIQELIKHYKIISQINNNRQRTRGDFDLNIEIQNPDILASHSHASYNSFRSENVMPFASDFENNLIPSILQPVDFQTGFSQLEEIMKQYAEEEKNIENVLDDEAQKRFERIKKWHTFEFNEKVCNKSTQYEEIKLPEPPKKPEKIQFIRIKTNAGVTKLITSRVTENEPIAKINEFKSFKLFKDNKQFSKYNKSAKFIVSIDKIHNKRISEISSESYDQTSSDESDENGGRTKIKRQSISQVRQLDQDDITPVKTDSKVVTEGFQTEVVIKGRQRFSSKEEEEPSAFITLTPNK